MYRNLEPIMGDLGEKQLEMYFSGKDNTGFMTTKRVVSKLQEILSLVKHLIQ